MKRHVHISRGNSKMGEIPSVSLPAGLTCRDDVPCRPRCYAARLERFRPNVHDNYEDNYRILLEEPDTYWREVEAAVMLSRFFRFHVSGDIPNYEYLVRLSDVMRRNPHCVGLIFTKRFSLVNEYLDKGNKLPENLKVIFSGWDGLQMENPHNLPEAHVIEKDGSTTARPDAVPCSGNCAECAVTDAGCWTIGPGQQVVFHIH